MNISFTKFEPFQLIWLLALIFGLNSWGKKGRTNNQNSEVRLRVMNNLQTRNNVSYTNTSTVRSVVSEMQMSLRGFVSDLNGITLVRFVRTFIQRTKVPYPYHHKKRVSYKRTVLFAKLEAFRTVFR